MRITFVISTMSSGGAERVAAILCNQWVAEGKEVTLILFDAQGNEPFYQLDKNINIKQLGVFGDSGNIINAVINNLIRLSKIRTSLKASNPDVVISFMTETNILTLVGGIFYSWPTIISERIHPAHHKISKLYSMLRKITYPLSYRLIVQTSSISQWFADNLLVRSVVIANPVQVACKKASQKNSGQRMKMIAAGRLEYQKGFDMLISAFSDISKEYQDWDLYIYGEGSQREFLTDLIRERGMEHRIRLCGKSKNLVDEMISSDLFVLSSRYEGFPNVLCEAMTSGMACIAFSCESGPSDIIQHNINGYLVEAGEVKLLADGMSYLISNPDIRLKYGAAARTSMKRYASEVIASQWNEVLTQAVENR